MTVPNENNFCGGAFDDWLEVMLTPKCNGKCEWCVERNGFHPKHKARVGELIDIIHRNAAKKVILLGGEPTLYKHLRELVSALGQPHDAWIQGQEVFTMPPKKVYLTTNGHSFNADFVAENLSLLTGVNVSIHHYGLECNKGITGITLDENTIEDAVIACRRNNITVRFNCNIIKGEVDSWGGITRFIKWAQERGVTSVRFSELMGDGRKFISLVDVVPYSETYGLSENPYVKGCNQNAEILGSRVNFRQMCGIQTECRVTPINPKSVNVKKVLYYDGKYYNGWQSQRRQQ